MLIILFLLIIIYLWSVSEREPLYDKVDRKMWDGQKEVSNCQAFCGFKTTHCKNKKDAFPTKPCSEVSLGTRLSDKKAPQYGYYENKAKTTCLAHEKEGDEEKCKWVKEYKKCTPYCKAQNCGNCKGVEVDSTELWAGAPVRRPSAAATTAATAATAAAATAAAAPTTAVAAAAATAPVATIATPSAPSKTEVKNHHGLKDHKKESDDLRNYSEVIKNVSHSHKIGETLPEITNLPMLLNYYIYNKDDEEKEGTEQSKEDLEKATQKATQEETEYVDNLEEYDCTIIDHRDCRDIGDKLRERSKEKKPLKRIKAPTKKPEEKLDPWITVFIGISLLTGGIMFFTKESQQSSLSLNNLM